MSLFISFRIEVTISRIDMLEQLSLQNVRVLLLCSTLWDLAITLDRLGIHGLFAFLKFQDWKYFILDQKILSNGLRIFDKLCQLFSNHLYHQNETTYGKLTCEQNFSFHFVFVHLQVTAKSKDGAKKTDTDGDDLAALREESLELEQEIQALKDE